MERSEKIQIIDFKKPPKAIEIFKWSIKENFSGYEPYDGLNFAFIKDIPEIRIKFFDTYYTNFLEFPSEYKIYFRHSKREK